MLSDADRQQIREEEIFREEVRADLKSLASPPSHSVTEVVWQFLNTSVGGWLLTTVLAGFIVWAFSYFQERRDEASRQAELREAVQLEVSYRLIAAEQEETPQDARDQLNDVFIDPQFAGWDFGAVLFKWASAMGKREQLIGDVLQFKSSRAAGDDFKDELGALRGKLIDAGLIDPTLNKGT